MIETFDVANEVNRFKKSKIVKTPGKPKLFATAHSTRGSDTAMPVSFDASPVALVTRKRARQITYNDSDSDSDRDSWVTRRSKKRRPVSSSSDDEPENTNRTKKARIHLTRIDEHQKDVKVESNNSSKHESTDSSLSEHESTDSSSSKYESIDSCSAKHESTDLCSSKHR